MNQFERVVALCQLLTTKPHTFNDLYAALSENYSSNPESARAVLHRDLKAVEQLGFQLEKQGARPKRYQISGVRIPFDEQHLRTLALIRDSFGANHPQFEEIQRLLDLLTGQLSPEELRIYFQRQTSTAPVQPAIDYRPHNTTIRLLEKAISQHIVLDFLYRNSHGDEMRHRVEPHNIEYYEQHFYLVGYSYDTKQIFDFRVDRIYQIRERQSLPPHLSRQHQRQVIRFRYRLAAQLARGEISRRFDQQRVVEYRENGDAIIEAEGNNAFFIVRTLLKYAGNAELLEPQWLRQRMLDDIRSLLAAYDGEV
jgi:predicted DNA-binding transcriptional regulator YafY